MGHPQPATPIHVDNSTAVGIANNTVKRQCSRSMVMRYFWIADQVRRGIFNVKWHPGLEQLGDYYTKHHPTSHHVNNCPYYLHEPSSPLILPRAPTPEELRGCAKIPMATPTGRLPLVFSNHQPFRQPLTRKPEGTRPAPITVAAPAVTFPQLSLWPSNCNLKTAVLSPWPSDISCY